MKLKFVYILMQWSKWFIFWNIFLHYKIIISFLELFSVTSLPCILKTQLTRRNTLIPKNLKNVNTWLSWWRHHICQFFYQDLFHIALSIQYMYKKSYKMDKKFLRYSMLFHRGPTSPPPMAAFAVNAVPHSMLD